METAKLDTTADEDEADYYSGGYRETAVGPGDGRRQEIDLDMKRRTRIRVQSSQIRKVVLNRSYLGVLENFQQSFTHLVHDFMVRHRQRRRARHRVCRRDQSGS
jgi:hypothetical protein